MFYHTSRGELLNLDFILEVVYAYKSTDGSHVYHAISKHAKYTLNRNDFEEIEKLTSPIIPARPDDKAIIFYYDPEANDGSGKEYFTELLPIVAWRIEGSVGVPIFVEDITENYGIIMPDGKICEPYSTTYDSAYVFEQSMLERAKRREKIRKKEMQNELAR